MSTMDWLMGRTERQQERKRRARARDDELAMKSGWAWTAGTPEGKAAVRAANAEKKAKAAERSEWDYTDLIRNGVLTIPITWVGPHKGLKTELPVAGCVAIVTEDSPRSRITATRVAAGAVIAGPVGALVGALARKDTTKTRLWLQAPDGREWTWEARTNGAIAALAADGITAGMQRVADAINAASAHYAAEL